MGKLSLVKPSTESERKTHTVVDTILVTPAIVNGWKSPPFQRPIKENDKVRALAEQLKHDGGVWPGIITLGVLNKEVYIVDGQHRRAAFLISALEEGYTDVRTHYFQSMADMGQEFVNLNSQLVRMRPDDLLRGLESSTLSLDYVRTKCPFVGYDYIRRNDSSPIISMATILRAWKGSAPDVPTAHPTGLSAVQIAQSMTDQDCAQLTDFLNIAMAAWGREPEYQRLWGTLNVILCMWLYRRMVLSQYSSRSPLLSKEQFKKCMMSLSADGNYLDWLVGRSMGERDRSPAYSKIKHDFTQRLREELGGKAAMPQPPWHSHYQVRST